MGVLDFLSPEARQGNRRWLDEQNAAIAEALRYYLGPTGIPDRLGMFADGTPSAGIDRAGSASTAMFQPGLSGWDRMARAGDMLSETAGAVTGLLGSPATVGMADDLAQEVAPTINRFMVDDFGGAKTLKPPMKGVDLPSLRDIPVEQALKIARREPHLIPSGAGSEGGYVGGPRTIQNKRDLGKMRRELDAYIAADPRGRDWYDRYRASVNEVTGGDPRDNLWMTNLEGQYSAGVSPQSEIAFALKDTNSMIARGDPGKPARPAQAAASRRAVAKNDGSKFQLGPKTGEYARLVDPSRGGQAIPSATGVNDFRHLRNLGYTETDGAAQKNAVGAAGHRFADYETALAVDRANRVALDGHTAWTGEQLQAAPWVRQKTIDFLEDGKTSYYAQARKNLGKDATEADLDAAAYELAFQGEGNRTIADFFDKHTAFATHEALPYGAGGQLEGLLSAPQSVRDAYSTDPLSTWALAPGGRDAIYGGMRHGDTGYAMRVRPTTEMQGVYDGPSGMEYNLGEVARPLVAFNTSYKPPPKPKNAPKPPPGAPKEYTEPDLKTVPDADRALLDMGEAVRGYVDYQGATPWHKNWAGGGQKASTSVFATRSSGPMPMEGLLDARRIGEKYQLPDVIDTGQGLTFTNFGIGPHLLQPKAYKGLLADLENVGGFSDYRRVKTDSGYPGYEGTWEQGVGSGAATRQLFEYLDQAPPQALQAMDANPYIPQAALNRLERDAVYAGQYGVAREDVQTARRIIGDGPGWVSRLREALAAGTVLPAIGAAVFLADDRREGI